jgi:hypothetical protein
VRPSRNSPVRCGTPCSQPWHPPHSGAEGQKSSSEAIREPWEYPLHTGVVTRQTIVEPRNRSRRDEPPKAAAHAAGDDLGDPRGVVATHRADPLGVLAQEADRTQGRQLAQGAQRDHLPLPKRLPMEPTAPAVRPQEHGPRLVPTLGRGGRLRGDLGGVGRRMRRTRRGAVGVAGHRRDAGQGPVRGGKRRARIPPIAGKAGPRRAC